MSQQTDKNSTTNENEYPQQTLVDDQNNTSSSESNDYTLIAPINLRADEIKKRGFYAAIKTAQDQLKTLIDETSMWHDHQRDEYEHSFLLKINQIDLRLNEIEEEIVEHKKRLDREGELEAELIQEHEDLNEQLLQLENRYQELSVELNELHKNALKNRLEEVQQELNALTDMHNDVFNKRIADEPGIISAKKKRIEICEDLLGKERAILDAISTQLTSVYRFGASKLSALFLISVGLGATTGAGWFFAIFTEKNNIDNENWLFFILTNIFEFISATVASKGAYMAVLILLGCFLASLLIISIIIVICEYFLYKVSDDRTEINLSLHAEDAKKRFLASLKVKGSSMLSFWLQVLPWIVILGALFLVVSVGNSINPNEHKIEELSNHLSGQLIGSTLSLVTTGVFFLFILKIIEPRQLLHSEKLKNDPTNAPKKSYREMLWFILLINFIILLIVIGQAFENFYLSRSALVSILLFLLLLNIAALTLSYGIRQYSLFRTRKISEEKVRHFGRYLEVLSSSKPAATFILEEDEFSRNFLILRQELIELINNKTKSLNQAAKIEQELTEVHKTEQPNGETTWKFRLPWFKKNNRSMRKRIQTYYKNNFPVISTQIDDQRAKIQACKLAIKDVKYGINHMRTKQSIFHSAIYDDLSKLRAIRKNFIKKREDQHDKRIEFLQEHENNRKREIHYLTEGYELGKWMQDSIINPTYENYSNE